MPELQWNLGWTVATLGASWLVLSCLVALALGQIIKRGKAKPEDTARADASEPRGVYADVAPTDDELADLEASRASGTRLKPVRFENEEARPHRKVS